MWVETPSITSLDTKISTMNIPPLSLSSSKEQESERLGDGRDKVGKKLTS